MKKKNSYDFRIWISKIFSIQFWKSFLFDTKFLLPVSVLLVCCEFALSLLVVENVKYTEIDWKAYMQEVEGFLNGTYDYSLLKGDTGPLVYPAGFVYIYSILYYITDAGVNIKLAQYLFAVLYAVTLILVFRLYVLSKKVPPYVLILMCATTYRIHSIYMLRLFNDPFAMFFLYLSLNVFLADRWYLGSIIYSFAVSIKMNVLLFSPALLVAYLTHFSLVETFVLLSICGGVQLVLGLPFLLTNPWAYLKGSFDLGRVFLFEWTVNWRFLPEEIFTSKTFHLFLLALHLILLVTFYRITVTYMSSHAKLKLAEADVKKQLSGRKEKIDMSSSSRLLLLPLFISNFIGVACSRSLHYQFYVWYYHQLPYLLWSAEMSIRTRLALLASIELAWNTFPSTYWSSAILHISHIIILFNLYKTAMKSFTYMSQLKTKT